jgi:hypothetical protein
MVNRYLKPNVCIKKKNLKFITTIRLVYILKNEVYDYYNHKKLNVTAGLCLREELGCSNPLSQNVNE